MAKEGLNGCLAAYHRERSYETFTKITVAELVLWPPQDELFLPKWITIEQQRSAASMTGVLLTPIGDSLKAVKRLTSQSLS